jgi:organic radical activating enzyme
MLNETTLTLSLPVMEQFYTIQGEGIHQGRAAYFIRLGGCDVGCVWCDVKESWDVATHPLKSIAAIIGEMQTFTKGGLVVITGGEPLMHPLDQLTEALHQLGYETSIETSGSHPLSGRWDNICLSPKKFKAPLPEILDKANELKIVVYNKSDFEWAETYAALVSKKCHLFLQPEWSKKENVLPLITAYVMDHPQWQLSLQIHKYINMP